MRPRGLSFRDTRFSRLSLDYLQIVRPLAKTGDDHIEESTEYNEVSNKYNEVITEEGSTEYNGLCTEYKEESTEYNSVGSRNNEENTKQS